MFPLRFLRTTALVCCMAAAIGCGRNETPAQEVAAPATDLRTLARDAYVWGFPMVDNYRVMHAYVLDKANPEYKAPFNSIVNMARLYTPQDKAIQTPNSDTPYSMLWLDLRAEPIVLSVPDIDPKRYYSVQLIDGYTHNAAYIGSRTTGNRAGKYLIAGPDWQGATPAGIDAVYRMETQFVFAIYRTQLFGAQDMDNVKRVQAGYGVQALSAFLGQDAPPVAPAIAFPAPLSPQEQRESPEFFNQLAFILRFIPTHPDAQAFRARLAAAGLVPGRRIDFDAMAPAQRDAIVAGMRDGQAAIDAARAKADSSVGQFGSRDEVQGPVMRALGTQAGIYANSPEEAMYFGAERDAQGAPLDGRNRYVLRFPKDGLPEVKGFWSVTMYDLPAQLLVDNPLDRYLINSTMLDGMQRDADGGLTLYLQHASPGADKAANWLPAPAGPFFIVMRNYWPADAIVRGQWAMPKPDRVD